MQIPAQPELDRLCGPGDWRVIGVSALVCDTDYVYLEVTKPRYWQTAPDGRTIITLGGVGGGLEPGEELLDCLAREAAEELGVSLRVAGAAGTRLIFEGTLRPGLFTDGDEPYPLLYTIGRNRRPDAAQDVGYLVIVTYLAEALGAPAPADLFGLLQVPRGRLRQALTERPVPLESLCRQTGAELVLNGELAAGVGASPRTQGTLVRPILTAESVRLLLAAGWLLTR